MMRLTVAVAVAALLIIPSATSPAQAETLKACADKRGDLAALKGNVTKATKDCLRRGGKIYSLKRPMGDAQDVEGEGVIYSWLNGSVDLIAEIQASLVHGENTCQLYIEGGPDLKITRLSDGFEPNNLQDEVEDQLTDDPLPYVRARVTFVVGSGASMKGDQFLTDDGFHIIIEDVLLTSDVGDEPGCYARVTVSGRHR